MSAERSEAALLPTRFVLFGALGDLSWRLVVPALFDLYLAGRLPGEFHLIGIDRDITVEKLAERLADGVRRFSPRGAECDAHWAGFARGLSVLPLNLEDAAGYAALRDALLPADGSTVIRIYYLAVPPRLIATMEAPVFLRRCISRSSMPQAIESSAMVTVSTSVCQRCTCESSRRVAWRSCSSFSAVCS